MWWFRPNLQEVQVSTSAPRSARRVSDASESSDDEPPEATRARIRRASITKPTLEAFAPAFPAGGEAAEEELLELEKVPLVESKRPRSFAAPVFEETGPVDSTALAGLGEDERGERLAAEAAADEERELAVMAKLDVRAPLDALLS